MFSIPFPLQFVSSPTRSLHLASFWSLLEYLAKNNGGKTELEFCWKNPYARMEYGGMDILVLGKADLSPCE